MMSGRSRSTGRATYLSSGPVDGVTDKGFGSRLTRLVYGRRTEGQCRQGSSRLGMSD